jgi:hypothetical protein
MIGKVKSAIIVAAIIVAAIVIICTQNKKIVNLRAEKIRLIANVDQLLDESSEYATLFLTQREALKQKSLKIDSISDLLKIKPKTITKIVFKEIIQHDTVKVQIPAAQINDTTWKFTDAGDCFVYKGEVTLSDNKVGVKRTGFDYHNEIIDTFFWRRKFWIFSKKKYFTESVATCGGASTKEINIIRKK